MLLPLIRTTTLTPEEFKNIFDANFDEIRNYIFYRCGDKELATDIAQESFLKLWEKREKIKLTNIKGLLFKMASELFINQYHHQKRTRKIVENIGFDHHDYSPEEILSFEQLKEKYESLIEKMPDNQRVVFLMSRIEGLQYREIAERIGLSVKAVEKRMGNALNYLRTSLISEN
ncbi:RNA polymerase sigma factor [Maribellus comscasis]|uniref:RNA polymerase sigma factor n=1 Tax=Maribellus comscasis TaxID=2681766 RepID=UPI001FEB366B|nr:sigma-70 family RNA polymerase sigma factor [Maribellus comscasis]